MLDLRSRTSAYIAAQTPARPAKSVRVGQRSATVAFVGNVKGGGSAAASPGPIATEDHVGRMGVMYVRAMLAQAALGNSETSPGEDHLSNDLNIHFRQGDIRVQIKAGAAKRRNKDGSFSISLKQKWRTDWAAATIPVYLVYVHLEKKIAGHWLDHPVASTTVHAHAYWVRVNGVSKATVRVPVQNRLTAATFDEWLGDLQDLFGTVVTA